MGLDEAEPTWTVDVAVPSVPLTVSVPSVTSIWPVTPESLEAPTTTVSADTPRMEGDTVLWTLSTSAEPLKSASISPYPRSIIPLAASVPLVIIPSVSVTSPTVGRSDRPPRSKVAAPCIVTSPAETSA